MRPEPINNILDIIPYKGGEAKIAGVDKVFKLSSNENPLGFSDAAANAYKAAAQELNIYPDGGHIDLRNAIGNRYGINSERILCANGSDEIFQLLGRAYLCPGDEIIQSEYGFLVYRLIAQQAGAICVSAKTKNYQTQIDAILAAITPKTKIIFIDNPSNPCGTYISFDEIKRLQSLIPANILLVLDAAYAEYVVANDYSSGLELAGEFENVLMTRTFSKIHGLAALRLGWCYGPQRIIDTLNRVRGPFNVSLPALKAGVAAIEDNEFTQISSNHNHKWLVKISQIINEIGLNAIPSATNFVMVEMQSAQQADDCDLFLKSKGIIVRKIGSYNLPNCLRISIGTDEANECLMMALREFMGK
jgi:histidinol-phosphate aminotransferase